MILIGHFVGVYLKQEVKCMKTKCLVQIAKGKEKREWFSVHAMFLREREKWASKNLFKRAKFLIT